MNKATFDELTKFAQNIVDSTPKDQLEDEWIAFNDEIDVNIWWEEDEPIRATAYPITFDSDGYATTHTDQEFCDIPLAT